MYFPYMTCTLKALVYTLPYASCTRQLLLTCFISVNYLAFATPMIPCEILWGKKCMYSPFKVSKSFQRYVILIQLVFSTKMCNQFSKVLYCVFYKIALCFIFGQTLHFV